MTRQTRRGTARAALAIVTGITACAEPVAGPERPSFTELAATTNACAPLPDGLISWWTGDADGTDLKGEYHGTLQNGAVAGRDAKVGGGFWFDGIDDYVSAAESPAVPPGGSLSLVAWVNVTSFGKDGAELISKGNTGFGLASYVLYIHPDRSAGIILNHGRYPGRPDLNQSPVGGGPLTAGTWHLLVGTFDYESTEANFYIDGQRHGGIFLSEDVKVMGGLYQVEAPLLLGKADRTGSPYPTTHFHGLLDEVQIYDRALAQEEIQAIYAAGAAGICRKPPTPPTAVLDGPYTGVEGSTISFDGSASLDPTGQGLTYSWDFGDGQTGAGPSPSHTYADDGTYMVSLTVTGESGSHTATTTAVVENVAPVVGAVSAPVDPQPVNISVTASAPFTDAGVIDVHQAQFDWNAEGVSVMASGSVLQGAGSGTASGSYTYTDAGVYTVRAIVADDDGGLGSAQFQYVVVYDPTAGFVTGSGHINSPPGAYPADPSITGKAIFAFVSRYKKGATVPTGNTLFKFKTAALDFSSTEYEWLVIAGARAQYKGSGRVNGAGDYGFMLTAIDGAVSGGGGVDRFRIKIWNKATGAVVYDNEMGAGDTAEPSTAIAGGLIVIHK